MIGIIKANVNKENNAAHPYAPNWPPINMPSEEGLINDNNSATTPT